MKRRKIVVIFLCVMSGMALLTVLSQPLLIKAIQAKYKSVDHFLTLQNDRRIRYEINAKNNALLLSGILSKSESEVVNILGKPFKQPINAYICATQESFNEYVFLSKNVRGAVYWGKIFLSPGAFSRGSLSDLTTHELTHYLFYTYLGEKASIENIALWFREGIAIFVANGGSSYTANSSVYKVMSRDERESYLSGKAEDWFLSNDPRDAVTSNGTANWLLYRIGALFVHYLHDLNPSQFDQLIQLLLSGEPFNKAISAIYKYNIVALRSGFSEYLKEQKNQARFENRSFKVPFYSIP